MIPGKISLLILTALFLCRAYGASPQIKVLKDDVTGIDLEVTFQDPVLSDMTLDGDAYVHIGMEGLCNTGKAGEPALPSVQYQVGVPAGECKISVLSSGGRSGTLSEPVSPVAAQRFRAGSRMDEDYFRPDPAAYALPLFPSSGALQTSYAALGNQRVLQLVLFPVTYSPSGKSYEFKKTIRVSVRFPVATGSKLPSQGYENILRINLLNYETAKSFRIAQPAFKRLAAMEISPFTNRRIFKITVKNSSECSVDGEGIYRISGQDILNAGGSLSGADLADMDGIRLYAASYGLVLDPNYAAGVEEKSALLEVPVVLRDNDADGNFGPTDELLFYGTGPTRIHPTATDFVFQINPYTFNNYYWLVLNDAASMAPPKRLDSFPMPSASPDKRTDFFIDRVHREANLLNPTKGTDYYKICWVWKELPLYSYAFSENLDAYLPDPAGPQGRFILDVINVKSRTDGSFSGDMSLNGVVCQRSGGKDFYFSNLGLSGGNSVTLGQQGGDDTAWFLNWYEVLYSRRLAVPNNRSLIVYGFPGHDTLFEYAMTGASSPGSLCLDVSDPVHPRFAPALLRNDTLLLRSYGFSPSLDSLKGKKFCVANPSGFKRPFAVENYARPDDQAGVIRNLRNPSHTYDYLVVAPGIFSDAAKRLARHRAVFEADAVKSTNVVLLEDVYDQFAAGKTDLSALRNFLVYAGNHWNTRYVVLLGGGHREYKYSTVPNYIPSYETFDPTENDLIRSPLLSSGGATDDFYSCTPGYGGIASGFRLMLGRLPVGNASEANWVVDKIIRFDTDNLSLKLWKNRALMVADDDMQFSGADKVNAQQNHMSVTESVCNDYLPASMDKVKVYLQRYPVKSTSREKPEAEYDMVEAVNEGLLIWVYVGHGSFEQLADEKVFTMTKTFGRLKNYDKCGFFWAASCNVGEYDNSNEGSICTRLVVLENAGMAGAVGASRLSDGPSNARLMWDFFKAVFRNPGQQAVSLGEGLVSAKFANNTPNSQFYNLFGDPAMYLYPRHGSIIIDNESVCDTLKMLQKVRLTGRVADAEGENCYGKISLKLLGSSETELVPYAKGDEVATQAVINPGALMTSVVADVKNSAFTLDFMIPKSVPFYTHGSSMNYFAWYGGHIAEKSYPDIYFSGEAPDAAGSRGDGKGPQITLYINSQQNTGLSFESAPAGQSFTINRKSIITVAMEDFDGIRTEGKNVNEGVLYEAVGLFDRRRVQTVNNVDGHPERKYFTLSVEQELYGITQNLTGQEYEFLVLAQDNYDNRSKASYKLRLDSDSGLALSRGEIYAYPNPFRTQTRFIWETTDPADVVIKVFTQSGRLIRVLESAAARGPYSPGANSVWDGKDEAGHNVARGIYYYSIKVNRIKPAAEPTSADQTNYPDEKAVTGKLMRY
jgi:hypothetical protein